MAKPQPITSTNTDFEPLPQEHEGGLASFKDATNKKLADIEQLTKYILFVAIISLVAVVVAVVGLVIEQFHYNSNTYQQKNSFNEQQVELLKDQNELLKDKINEQKTIQKTN